MTPTQRRGLAAGAALGASVLLPGLAAHKAAPRSIAGVTLNVSTFSAAYPKLLQQWLPEFEALTGAKVNFDAPSFPVYNQRADLELSTQGLGLRRGQRDVHLLQPLDQLGLAHAAGRLPEATRTSRLRTSTSTTSCPARARRKPARTASSTAFHGQPRRCSPHRRVSTWSNRRPACSSPTPPTIW
jgi:hypothetical protein